MLWFFLASMLSYMAFVLSLFVPPLSFVNGISWIPSLIFMQQRNRRGIVSKIANGREGRQKLVLLERTSPLVF